MSLPELLGELAALLPERITCAATHSAVIWRRGRWRPVVLNILDDQDEVELALREECEARSWPWGLQRTRDAYATHMHRAYVQHTPTLSRKYADADAPVVALASALVKALKAEAASCP